MTDDKASERIHRRKRIMGEILPPYFYRLTRGRHGRSSASVSPQFPRSRRSDCRDCKYETIPDITQIPEECYVLPLCASAGRPVGFCSEPLQPRAESGRNYQARRGPNVRTLLGPTSSGLHLWISNLSRRFCSASTGLRLSCVGVKNLR